MSDSSPKNVFVIGLDDFNREQLESLPDAGLYRIHELLSHEEIKSYGKISFDEMLARAEERLDQSPESADAIITWWDFPATSLQAILTSRRGLPGPSLESTLKCEHKYWSRFEQKKVASDAVPAFAAINPFEAPDFDRIEVEPPFWIKPVKGTDSMLGFKIGSEAEYREALDQIREKIGQVAEPFNEILDYADLPAEIGHVDGHYCLAEGILNGTQHTVTGYVRNGEVVLYGLIDSVNYPGGSSFFRYEYPSRLDPAVGERMWATSQRVIEHLHLDNSAFNIEYFYDEETDAVTLLEINPRISQSHSDVFYKVDGESDEALIVRLGLDREPRFPRGQGKFHYAAKFYYRRFEDGFVRRVPGEAELVDLRNEFPDTLIHVEAQAGKRLSDLAEQDSYSFVLAILFIGADTREGLIEKFDKVTERLEFDIDPV